MTADHERNPPPILGFAVALSVSVGAFAVFGWLVRGGLLPWQGWEHLEPEAARGALYAALAIIVQGTNAVAAMAARWASGFGLEGSARWARRAVAAGGMWNAYSLHNAFTLTLDHNDWTGWAIAWAVSAAIAFMDIALYFINDALQSEVQRRRSVAQDEALNGARRGRNVDEIELVSLTDAALEAHISGLTGAKRNAEVERRRRSVKKKLTGTALK